MSATSVSWNSSVEFVHQLRRAFRQYRVAVCSQWDGSSALSLGIPECLIEIRLVAADIRSKFLQSLFQIESPPNFSRNAPVSISATMASPATPPWPA